MVRKQKVTVVTYDVEIIGVYKGGISRAMKIEKKEAKIEAKESGSDFALDRLDEYRYEEVTLL